MAFQITIQPSNRQFSAEPGETVLAAAMRNGITLP
jgi:CDP-4-dehydro-6-deoxyglucose reductase